jgi:hypothetical protein
MLREHFHKAVKIVASTLREQFHRAVGEWPRRGQGLEMLTRHHQHLPSVWDEVSWKCGSWPPHPFGQKGEQSTDPNTEWAEVIRQKSLSKPLSDPRQREQGFPRTMPPLSCPGCFPSSSGLFSTCTVSMGGAFSWTVGWTHLLDLYRHSLHTEVTQAASLSVLTMMWLKVTTNGLTRHNPVHMSPFIPKCTMLMTSRKQTPGQMVGGRGDRPVSSSPNWDACTCCPPLPHSVFVDS